MAVASRAELHHLCRRPARETVWSRRARHLSLRGPDVRMDGVSRRMDDLCLGHETEAPRHRLT
eukprot:5615584-Heterocapsa_arctica.AAC.1